MTHMKFQNAIQDKEIKTFTHKTNTKWETMFYFLSVIFFFFKFKVLIIFKRKFNNFSSI